MTGLIVAVLLALQEVPDHNAAPVLSVSLMSIVIGIIMVCLLILGLLSLSERNGRRNRTRT